MLPPSKEYKMLLELLIYSNRNKTYTSQYVPNC